jgi:hypothetical protein
MKMDRMIWDVMSCVSGKVWALEEENWPHRVIKQVSHCIVPNFKMYLQSFKNIQKHISM